MGNLISDLASGAASGVFSGLGSLAKDIRVAITGIDPVRQADLEEKLLALEAAGNDAQMKVNEIEAASSNVFVSGWRPFIGWTCGAAFAYNFVLTPFIQRGLVVTGTALRLPVLDIGTMMPVLLGMLGLGGLRSWDKKNGVASK